MKPILLYVFMSLIAFTACHSSKSIISVDQLDAFDDLVKKKRFQIESDRLYPQGSMALQQVLNSGLLQGGSNANNISLIGNHNFLRISGDSISSYLPFYGERHMTTGYGGSDSAIELVGLMKHYKVEQNKDKSYDITFEANTKNEGFRVFIKVRPNFKSDMTLSGNTRSSIQFSGEIKPL